MKVEFDLNGEPVEADVDPAAPLRDVLRDELGATEVKSSCESGRCGVCTVHLDGAAVKSCLILAGKADGKSVVTATGQSENPDLQKIEDAFSTHFGFQCGYCTPGFVMMTAELAADEEEYDREDIKRALKGNLCRCTGYRKILDSVEAVLADD